MLGLLAQFLQERRTRGETAKQATLDDLREWLRRRDHAEILSVLESNRELVLALQHMLNVGHDELLERFDRLESMLNRLLGSTAEWSELVRSIDPKAGLSDQAIDILRWFDTNGVSMATHVDTREGPLLLPNGVRTNYIPSESRFFPDDMTTLVGYGLLILGYGSRGSPNFTITRAAVEFVKNLPDPGEGHVNSAP